MNASHSTPRKQQTIARPTTVCGFGYWSGLDVCVECRPAIPDSGITFVRADLAGQPRIPASVLYRVDSLRRTTLAAKQASVELVEHVLAALFGLQVDNCEVWVDRAELPGLDGSSLAYTTAILESGILVQDAFRKVLKVERELTARLGNGVISIRPTTRRALTVSYDLEYEDVPAIQKQSLTLDVTPQSFLHELASARTFLLKREADWMNAQGLGKRVTYQDLLVFDHDRILENQLRFPDECVRHKALDVIGDLALLGSDIIGHVYASRSGHTLNASLVQLLRSEMLANGLQRRSA